VFTGLIEATGLVQSARLDAMGGRLRIETTMGTALAIGDSIAVNGVCLTAVEVGERGFAADVSPQTLRVTTAHDWCEGTRVNLERPLRADARLGGHFVLGHVDAVATVASVRAEGESYWVEFVLPGEIAPYMIAKGSVAVDGISLTIADLRADRFAVQVIPHTWAVTSLGAVRAGDRVNLEADVLGKHVARLVALGESGGVS
jgi:riboflavin synthase